MFPYLIAGAIGFVVAKLFEEDETPKYSDGGIVPTNKYIREDLYENNLEEKLYTQAGNYFAKKITDDYWHFSTQYFNGSEITYEVYSEMGGFWVNFQIKNNRLILSSIKLQPIIKDDIRFDGGGEVPKTSKDENGNWIGEYLGLKFILLNLREGWVFDIYFYSPIMLSEKTFFSNEDYEPFRTKKDALNSVIEKIIEINSENDDFIKRRKSNNSDIRFDEGGETRTYLEFYDKLKIEDGSKYIGQKFMNIFPFLGRRKVPQDFRKQVNQYDGVLKRLKEDDYSTKAMKQTDLNKLEKIKEHMDKKKYLSRFYLDSRGVIISFK